MGWAGGMSAGACQYKQQEVGGNKYDVQREAWNNVDRLGLVASGGAGATRDMAKKLCDDFVLVDLCLFKVASNSADEFISRAIHRNVEIVKGSILPQRALIQARNVCIRRRERFMLLLLLFMSDQFGSFFGALLEHGGLQCGGMVDWTVVVVVASLETGEGGEGRLVGGVLYNGESVSLNADESAIVELHFMPAAECLGGADGAGATDEIPFGAVIAGDAHGGSAREDGVRGGRARGGGARGMRRETRVGVGGLGGRRRGRLRRRGYLRRIGTGRRGGGRHHGRLRSGRWRGDGGLRGGGRGRDGEWRGLWRVGTGCGGRGGWSAHFCIGTMGMMMVGARVVRYRKNGCEMLMML